MEYFFFNYLRSLAEFWSFAFRLGLPQILLIVLVVWWLKRSRCGQDDDCCGVWTLGTRWGCCRGPRSNNCCCRQDAGCEEAPEEAHEEAQEAVEDDD